MVQSLLVQALTIEVKDDRKVLWRLFRKNLGLGIRNCSKQLLYSLGEWLAN
jgi:hypothetical protein